MRELGHAAVEWNDDWWTSGQWPRLADQAVVFHGSLANAARVHDELPWRPGSFCDVDAFRCAAWYEAARPWLLHDDWRATTAEALCQDPSAETDGLADLQGRVFVRPDSPLKPFSGRVLPASEITLERLDHGFYFDDASIPVVVTPVRDVGREWRFVVVDGEVVTGCEYVASSRGGAGEPPPAAVHSIAAEVAGSLPAPAAVYVLDVCEADGELRLVELNPFGGADLYDCDPRFVVEAVANRSQ